MEMSRAGQFVEIMKSRLKHGELAVGSIDFAQVCFELNSA
jgi:hypothetical protein